MFFLERLVCKLFNVFSYLERRIQKSFTHTHTHTRVHTHFVLNSLVFLTIYEYEKKKEANQKSLSIDQHFFLSTLLFLVFFSAALVECTNRFLTLPPRTPEVSATLCSAHISQANTQWKISLLMFKLYAQRSIRTCSYNSTLGIPFSLFVCCGFYEVQHCCPYYASILSSASVHNLILRVSEYSFKYGYQDRNTNNTSCTSCTELQKNQPTLRRSIIKHLSNGSI